MDLALFDLDNTLLAGDSDHMWGQFLVTEGIVDGATYERENDRFYEQYKAGELDVEAYQHFTLQPLVNNPPQRMLALRERFVREHIEPIVARHAPALLESHRKRGDCLVIITATNRFVTEPIAALLGIEHLLATELEQTEGRYTGNVSGVACFQAGKIERLAEWRATQTQQFRRTCFYSDSHNDLPLLREVDQPIAVDPDATLISAAKAASWPIISLRGAEPPAFQPDVQPAR